MAPAQTPWYSKEYKDPKKEHLFLVKLGNLGELWYAKTANKPSVSYEAGGSLLDGVSFFGDPFLYKDKPAVTYETVSVTLLDPVVTIATGDGEDATTKLMSLVGASHNETTGQFSIKEHRKALGQVEIYQYTPGDGNKLEQVETWKLIAPQIISIRFGDLDYGSDDSVEIIVEIDYMGFTYSDANQGTNEKLKIFRELIDSRIENIK
jgi:hypothetical protein